jgi:hypothetical protein
MKKLFQKLLRLFKKGARSGRGRIPKPKKGYRLIITRSGDTFQDGEYVFGLAGTDNSEAWIINNYWFLREGELITPGGKWQMIKQKSNGN